MVLGSFAGINGWLADDARRFAQSVTTRPTLTTTEMAMPMAHLGYTKISEEHGQWAGDAAVAILDGMSPSQIPLATNRQWDAWVNPAMIERGGLTIDERLLRRAKTVQ